MKTFEEEVLKYHRHPQPGKISIAPTKAMNTREDLMLAYTPGVALPCLKIHESQDASYHYTSRGNLVAVVTDGSAVLGLGAIGPYAAKPVMEGKAVLFKRFADIDVFDIEFASQNTEEFIRACQMLEPTVGGINLEDVKAPECFVVEEALRKTMKIPIFHDDQHGTAIICAAAFLNALELAEKDIARVRVVFNGAGAAALACADMFIELGVRAENLLMCDSKGVLHEGRDPKEINSYKKRFVRRTPHHTLADAMRDSDVFVGCSVKGVVTPQMIRSMSDRPIVFAMANPDPEITYPDAVAVRKDIIMATGRSDYPNQVNNVLCFPFMFRGALDVRATTISKEMKHAAVKALAALAKEPVPESVSRAYGNTNFNFSPEYFIPKPFDPRAFLWVSAAVAEAAMASGVARTRIDINEYKRALEDRLGRTHKVIRHIKDQAYESLKKNAQGKKSDKIKIVFPEGLHPKILKACQMLLDGDLVEPIVLGTEQKIRALIKKENIGGLDALNIVKPSLSEHIDHFARTHYEEHQRKGMTLALASYRMFDPRYFGAMMVRQGFADGYLAGLTTSYPEGIKPLLEVIGTHEGTRLSSVYAMLFKDRQLFFTDPAVNIAPRAEDLCEIALNAAKVAESFNVEPSIAFLSYSNFGSNESEESVRIQHALQMVRARRPDLKVDGEMQADTAISEDFREENYPFCVLKGPANVLVFPNLSAGNIATKLLKHLGGAESIGPILVGMRRPSNVLQRAADVNEIVHMALVTAREAAALTSPHRSAQTLQR